MIPAGWGRGDIAVAIAGQWEPIKLFLGGKLPLEFQQLNCLHSPEKLQEKDVL